MATVTALMCTGPALDALLGEARRWHPLVGFGRAARLLAVGPVVGVSVVALQWVVACHAACAGVLQGVVHLVLPYFSLGLRSLREHTRPIARAWPGRVGCGTRAERTGESLAVRGSWLVADEAFADAAPGGIRIGLPPDEAGWRRLETALDAWKART